MQQEQYEKIIIYCIIAILVLLLWCITLIRERKSRNKDIKSFFDNLKVKCKEALGDNPAIINFSAALFAFDEQYQYRVKAGQLKDIDNTLRHAQREYQKLQFNFQELENRIAKRKEFYRSINGPIPEAIKKIASAYSDIQYIDDECTIRYLERKTRKIRAYTATEFRKILKEEKRKAIESFKTIQYKYEYLLATFPELQNAIEQDNDIDVDGQNLIDEDNESSGWLSREEWDKLSDSERNQLALDRYNNSRKKSLRRIGIDYELYCGYYFRKQGALKVIQHGEEKGLEDLGRDIIVQFNDKTLIVQCKRWSDKKVIRENCIAQLYGTAAVYCMENYPNEKDPIERLGKTVIPVIMTTTQLSDTAMNFTKKLGVEVKVLPCDVYPQIKCNINNGNKIYHLPFDQQYYRTKISETGEFYAFTVREAEEHGFRRALRHMFN